MPWRNDYHAIHIANLSAAAAEIDLEYLVKSFGPIQRSYLATDKITNVCKEFAYIYFKFINDAAKAISILNGCDYDHLILTADWLKTTWRRAMLAEGKVEDETKVLAVSDSGGVCFINYLTESWYS